MKLSKSISIINSFKTKDIAGINQRQDATLKKKNLVHCQLSMSERCQLCETQNSRLRKQCTEK